MSVAVLSAAFVSVEPAPAVTVAVLTRLPVRFGLTVPVMVIVSVLVAPGARLAFVKLTFVPADVLVPHEPSPTTAQLALTPLKPAGSASAIDTPVAMDGPAFVTTRV